MTFLRTAIVSAAIVVTPAATSLAFAQEVQMQGTSLCVVGGGPQICINRTDGGTSLTQGNVVWDAHILAELRRLTAAVNSNGSAISNGVNQSATSINSTVATGNKAISDLSAQLQAQVKAFNSELRKSIDERFDNLSKELASSPAIVQLRKDILAEIDKRIAESKKQ